MPKILSQEEIDALLKNVGQDDGSSLDVIEGVEKKVTPYDFSHPQLLSKEQERMIENIHENFCRSFSVYLSAQLRLLVEIRQLAIEQFTYSEFVTSLASPTCLYIIDFNKPGGRGLLEMSSKLTIFIVEKLFGGQTTFQDASDEREVTHIEQKVMQRVIDRCLHELSKAWVSENDINMKMGSFESNPDYAQIVSSSEPVVVLSLEVVIHGNKTILNICYPYNWISKVMMAEEFTDQMNEELSEINSIETESIANTLHKTDTHLSAILGKVEITIRDFLELTEGDVLLLSTKIDSSIPVMLENKHLFDAFPGSHRKSKALKISKIY